MTKRTPAWPGRPSLNRRLAMKRASKSYDAPVARNGFGRRAVIAAVMTLLQSFDTGGSFAPYAISG